MTEWPLRNTRGPARFVTGPAKARIHQPLVMFAYELYLTKLQKLLVCNRRALQTYLTRRGWAGSFADVVKAIAETRSLGTQGLQSNFTAVEVQDSNKG